MRLAGSGPLRLVVDHGVDHPATHYVLSPPAHVSSPVPPQPLFLVTPPPLVEPLEVSSDPIGPAKGGDLAADDTAASWRSPRLEASPGFPPRPSSPPLQPVAMDPGAAGGGDTKGTGFGRPSGGGVEGALAGGSAGALQSLRQRPLYWEQQQSSLPFLESMAGGTRDGGTGAGGAGGYGAGSTAAKGT
ncbi:unnamed protein product [Closterium sp. NIES-53]